MKDSVIKGTGNSRYLKSSLEGITTWEQFRAALAAGTFPVDLNGINPEGFQQLGDPLIKATLLKDSTAALLGLGTDAVPDDAFVALILGQGVYGYRVKVQLEDGTPVEGSTVSGIQPLTGSTLVTGADGIVLGKSTSKTVTIGCTSPYVDQAAPASQSVTATGTITDVTLTLTAITGIITITSSKTGKVSLMAKTMDVTAVGGGGGGGSGTIRYDRDIYGGAGGGGGYVSTSLNVPISGNKINIAIGAGGARGVFVGNNKNGGDGGQGGVSKIILGETIINANGGAGGEGARISTPAVAKGGDGNGKGGQGGWDKTSGNNATDGGNGTQYIFDKSSLGLAGGGGGGGGSPQNSNKVCAGGKPGGASGANYSDENYAGGNVNAGEAKTGGGGGGGSGKDYQGTSSNGGNGIAYLQFHFKEVQL